MDLFGLPPNDGSIHCRICGEELCKEEFSTFEGFPHTERILKI